MKKPIIMLSLIILLISNTIKTNYLADVCKYAIPATKSIFVSTAERTYETFLANNDGLKEFLLNNGFITSALLLGGGIGLLACADTLQDYKNKVCAYISEKKQINTTGKKIKLAINILGGLSLLTAGAYLFSTEKCNRYFSNSGNLIHSKITINSENNHTGRIISIINGKKTETVF